MVRDLVMTMAAATACALLLQAFQPAPPPPHLAAMDAAAGRGPAAHG